MDLTLNLPKNINKLTMKLHYFTSNPIEDPFHNVIFEKPEEINCLGLYYHSGQAKDWIPCILTKKIFIIKKREYDEVEKFKYFEVLFPSISEESNK